MSFLSKLPGLCRTILWVTVGQAKQGHPVSAELSHQAAGHGIARQEHGMAAQQVSQHKGAQNIMCTATATRKGKGQDSRHKVNGQKKGHRLPLEDRGRYGFWFHPS